MTSTGPAGGAEPHTVLAGAAAAQGGGGGDTGGGVVGGVFASSAADKKKAATYMEQHQLPDTSAASVMADGGAGGGGGAVGGGFGGGGAALGGGGGGGALGGGASPSVISVNAPLTGGTPDTGLKGMSAWATENGLSAALGTWHGQAARLMARLEGELNALRGANAVFEGNDFSTGADLKTVQAGSIVGHSRVGDL